MKKFKLGFIVGRFQMLHKGHEQLIDIGLEMCERFVILLGSSDESRTKKNPFTFEERCNMIATVYGDKVIVLPIANLGIGYIPAWGNYVMNTIYFALGEYPDFVINGNEDGRNNWIDKQKFHGLTEFTVSRDLIDIHATDVRQIMLQNREKLDETFISKNYTQEEYDWYRIVLKEVYQYHGR